MKLYIQTRFAQTPKDLIDNAWVSLRAKWLYAVMQSKPDGWDFSADRLSRETKEWTWVIKSTLRELEEYWYLMRIKRKNDKWQWEWEYVLYAIPTFELQEEVENPSVGNPPMGNPPTENPPTVNRPTNKERSTKKELNKKNIEIYVNPFLSQYPKQRISSKLKVTEKLSRLSEQELQDIIISLPIFIKFWEQEKTETKYIPLAMTWLNQRRWEIPPEIKQKQPNSSDIYTNPIN